MCSLVKSGIVSRECNSERGVFPLMRATQRNPPSQGVGGDERARNVEVGVLLTPPLPPSPRGRVERAHQHRSKSTHRRMSFNRLAR